MLVERLTLLPAGTTSNEALHEEINNWLRQTKVRISEDTQTLVNPSLKPYFYNIDRRDYPLDVHDLGVSK